jgi:hypothetical protein
MDLDEARCARSSAIVILALRHVVARGTGGEVLIEELARVPSRSTTAPSSATGTRSSTARRWPS